MELHRERSRESSLLPGTGECQRSWAASSPPAPVCNFGWRECLRVQCPVVRTEETQCNVSTVPGSVETLRMQGHGHWAGAMHRAIGCSWSWAPAHTRRPPGGGGL